MINTGIRKFCLFGIPIFSISSKEVGPTSKEVAERLAPLVADTVAEKITPQILEALKEDESLIEAVGEKIAVTLRQEIATALGGGTNGE